MSVCGGFAACTLLCRALLRMPSGKDAVLHPPQPGAVLPYQLAATGGKQPTPEPRVPGCPALAQICGETNMRVMDAAAAAGVTRFSFISGEQGFAGGPCTS